MAKDSHWIVLDDSSTQNGPANRELADNWRRSGLRIAYVDRAVEREIASALPWSLRADFDRLAARSPACASEGGRNLGLIFGLALRPSVLFAVDDDIVHRHGETCFFHWCVHSERTDNFVAAPQQFGVLDTTYLPRLLAVLSRDDWEKFLTGSSLSADPDLWRDVENRSSPGEPAGPDTAAGAVAPPEAIAGGFTALHNTGEECLPFPNEFNSDLNWSILQSAFCGSSLVTVQETFGNHLPPSFGHLNSESVFSQLLGVAITAALCQLKRRGELSESTLPERLPNFIAGTLRKEVGVLLAAERAVQLRLRRSAEGTPARAALVRIASTLAALGEPLKSVEYGRIAADWLEHFNSCRASLAALRRDETSQSAIRELLFAHGLGNVREASAGGECA